MKRKIIGATVGTPQNPNRIKELIGDGKSAYELAVENGFEGTETEWLASLHGKDGISPTVTVEDITGGHRVTIIVRNGQNVFDVMDGEPDPPKDFELIETFTVTEDGIRSFERKEEPNGEKYCFDKIFIQMRYPIPENDMNTGFFELKINGESTTLYGGYSTGMTIKSTDRYNLIVTIMAEIDNGMISGRNNVTLDNSLEKSSQNHGTFCKYVGGEKIRRVYILTGSPVPVGTIYEIRGVRADV